MTIRECGSQASAVAAGGDAMVIDRAKTILPSLVADTPPAPESFWRGRLLFDPTGDERDLSHSYAPIEARLAIGATLIEGAGVIGPPAVTITGARRAERLDFTVWFEEDSLEGLVLECHGTLNDRRDRIEATWSSVCPTTCGCGGFHGRLHLEKIETRPADAGD